MKTLIYLLLTCMMPIAVFGQKITGITATASTGNAALAVDGNTNTRWESAFSDPQWISLDLGANYNVSKVVIKWEAANAKNYTLEGSTDGINWTIIQTLQNMPGGNRTDTLKNINANYRYLKINGTVRNLNYGYSIWEIEVYQVSVPVLSGLKILPSSVQVTFGTVINFVAVGIDQNNDPYPLVEPTVWSVNSTDAKIDTTGKFIANEPGFYTITATNQTFTAQSKVEVLPVEQNINNVAKAYASTGNARLAIDNNVGTRWESAFSDPQWIMFAFDTIRRIYGFRINWEAANARDYIIEGSVDSTNWYTLAQKTNMPGGARIDVIYDIDSADCKYIRLTGLTRTLPYGYSIWEFAIYERSRQTPDILWNNPLPITYGTPLSSLQLNATTNVSGSMVYYPSAGTVLSAGVHTLYVRFYPSDPLSYTQVVDSVTLIVKKFDPSVQWEKPDTIVYGTKLGDKQLNAYITNGVVGNFVYTPARDSRLSAGKHILRVEFIPEDTLNYSIVKDSTEIVVKKAIPEIVWTSPEAIIYGNRLSTQQLNASVEGFVGTYIYNYSLGTLLNAGKHVLSVTFKPDDTSNVVTVSKSVELLVKKAKPSVIWNLPNNFGYGKPLSNWPYIPEVEGKITFSLSPDSILPIGSYTVVVGFVPTDTMNYIPISDTASFTITKARPEIVWDNPSAIVYGTSISNAQLNAQCLNVTGTFHYSVSLNTILSAGKHQLKVNFIPQDTINYEFAEAEVELVVLKATPVISWNKPASIVEGTPLGTDQLNATANIQGTFHYNPALGTILAPGNHTLKVTFVPNDTLNYSTASTEVVIEVTPKTSATEGKFLAISIYPNPFTDHVVISNNGKSNVLKIYDAFGRIVKVKALHEKGSRIMLSDLPTGLYYFEVDGSVYKVIKR
ncbi:MAG: discoidin domain-containing protein [Bacteroidales bacterium]|nr:discoidin domain-containing protein [Bacteroidales bacterium]